MQLVENRLEVLLVATYSYFLKFYIDAYQGIATELLTIKRCSYMYIMP